MQATRRSTARHGAVPWGNPWLFFVVTYAITWGFWLAAIALGLRFDSAVGLGVLLIGLLGPGVAGVGFAYLVFGTAGLRDFRNRIVQVRRVGLRWFVVILSIPIGVTVLAGLVDTLLGGPGATWGEGVLEMSLDPLAILPALFFATLPPLLEELGWRGYALDRLQLNRSAFGASVILGVVWAAWHLPLFFVEGSFQREVVGFATMGFWLFMIGTVALSVVFTWVYNRTARSILAIVLLHGWVNFVSETVEVADVFYYPTWVVLALLFVAIWGAKTLTDDDAVPRPPEAPGRTPS